jgi:hypothetical protein
MALLQIGTVNFPSKKAFEERWRELRERKTRLYGEDIRPDAVAEAAA